MKKYVVAILEYFMDKWDDRKLAQVIASRVNEEEIEVDIEDL